MTRRRWVALALVVIIASALAVVTNGRREEHIGRRGSVALSAGQPVTINRAPAAYRIDYRVEEQIGRDVRVSTDKVWVRRPFESRTETWDGAPPGRTRVKTVITALGRTSNARPRADTSRVDQPPAVAAADVRLAAALPAAVDAGVLRRRERRHVAGRTCQVFRTSETFIATTLLAPNTGRYVDACVDRDGLVLEELQVVGGENETRRVAVRVDLAPALTDAMFAVGPANVPPQDGGGSTRAVAPTSTPPGPFWQLDGIDGFTVVGRYAVVPPQPGENFSDPSKSGARLAGISDVFRRGLDVVIIDQGATAGGEPPWAADPTNTAVDLGPLGRGEVVLTARGPEVRALMGAGHYVRVFGTLPPDDLAAIARQLHQVPGTQLVYLP